MKTSLLIQGGSVIDGSGAPAYKADVRVKDGIIVELGENLDVRDEAVIDASGAYVTPGFIEPHTHLDGALWWDPSLNPLPGQGVTSLVMGLCGNSVAPLPKEHRAGVIDLLSYLEDIPQIALAENMPWSWETWPEYKAVLGAHKTAVNVESMIGHIALRIYVMGEAAWDRAATAEEISQMAAVLDEALANGALGFTSNIYDIDRHLKDVPPKMADDAEFDALFAVLGKHSGKTFQSITRFPSSEHHIADVERMARLCRPYNIRAQWASISTQTVNVGQERIEMSKREYALHQQLKANGDDFWPNFSYTPLVAYYTFQTTLVFDAVPAWHYALNSPTEEKMQKLIDPDWRAQARVEWDNKDIPEHIIVKRPHHMILYTSQTGAGPLGITLKDYADQLGLHVSDALAEWLCQNGDESTIKKVPIPLDEPLVVELFKDPQALCGINDSGAHLQLFCGAGQTMALFTHYVRENGDISVEEAVHIVTGKWAGFYGLNDRGLIEVGRNADINIFELDKLQLMPEIQVRDTPGGSWRFTREAAGFRTTMVRGEITCDNGEYTGARPGTCLQAHSEQVKLAETA